MKHPKEQARATRVEMYADWIADDVDGLIHNVAPAMSAGVLAEARAKIAAALAQLDSTIAAQEPA